MHVEYLISPTHEHACLDIPQRTLVYVRCSSTTYVGCCARWDRKKKTLVSLLSLLSPFADIYIYSRVFAEALRRVYSYRGRSRAETFGALRHVQYLFSVPFGATCVLLCRPRIYVRTILYVRSLPRPCLPNIIDVYGYTSRDAREIEIWRDPPVSSGPIVFGTRGKFSFWKRQKAVSPRTLLRRQPKRQQE